MKTIWLALGWIVAMFTCGEAASPTRDAVPASWLGAVTLSEGEAFILRQRDAWTTRRGAGVSVGDTLITRQRATLSLAVYDGPALTMSENSRVKIYKTGERLGFEVIQGEVRVVHGSDIGLELAARGDRVDLGRSIVRLVHDGNSSTVLLEAGSARTNGVARAPQDLEVGKTYRLDQNRATPSSDSPSWRIDPSYIRLASATQTSPVLSIPSMPRVQDCPPSHQPTFHSQPYCEGVPMIPTPSTPSADSNVVGQPDSTTAPQQSFQEQQQPFQEPQPQQTQPPAADVAASRGASSSDSDASGTKSLSGSTFSGSSSLTLGSFSGSSGSFSSGGLFADAGQQTFEGQVTAGSNFPTGSPFAGSIHLVTAETNYSMTNVRLNTAEQQAIGGQNFYSIGLGSAPTGQVTTSAITGTNAIPTTLTVPGQGAYVVKLDQYGVPDPATPANGGLNSNIGITGLVGSTPAGPTVAGTAPLVDERALLNSAATFALGEFRVSTDSNGGIAFSIRRSDQDRLIVKDANNNDANDLVTPNSDVSFQDIVDARFLSQSATVKAPLSNGSALNARGTTYTELNTFQKAAITTIMADTLQGYANRTGQTRFVVDGKIIDISGYQPAP